MRGLFLNNKRFFLSFFLSLVLVIITGKFLFSEKDKSEVKKLDIYLKIAKEIRTINSFKDKKDFVIILLEKLDKEFNLSEDERKYVTLLRSSFQKEDFSDVNSLFLSSKDIKVGIIITQNKKLIVLKKETDINEKIVKAESLFYDLQKSENFEGLQNENHFFPLILVSKVFNGNFTLTFLNNKDDWRKLTVIINSEKFSPNAINLFYLLGKILSSGVGPFFVKNNYFVITVKDRFKKDFLILEEVKVKIMALLFLKMLQEKKILETSDKAIFSAFINDFKNSNIARNIIIKVIGDKPFEENNMKKEFGKLKKLLRKIIRIEKEGDLKAFESLKSDAINDGN